MKRLLPILCLVALACGGSKQSTESTTPTDDSTATSDATEPATEAETSLPATTDGSAAQAMSREEIAEKTLELFAAMAKAATDNRGDCDAFAGVLDTLLTDNRPLMEAGEAVIDGSPENKKWFQETYQEKLMGIMSDMMPVLDECKDNEKLKATMEKLG